jgi:hypothetical protein
VQESEGTDLETEDLCLSLSGVRVETPRFSACIMNASKYMVFVVLCLNKHRVEHPLIIKVNIRITFTSEAIPRQLKLLLRQ